MSMFKKETREAHQQVEKSEHWSTEIDGYDVYVNRRDDNAYSVGVYPNKWRGEYGQDRMRLPLLDFHPKHVDEFVALADMLPAVLRQLAEAMRAEGLVDLRSKYDIMHDEMQAKLAAIRSK